MLCSQGFNGVPSSETQGLLAGRMGYFGGERYFRREGLLQELKSPWELILTEPVLEVVEIRPSGQSARRSSQVTMSPSYTTCFSSSFDLLGQYSRKTLVESLIKKDSSKPRKSPAVTWGLGSNTQFSLYFYIYFVHLYLLSTFIHTYALYT